MRNGFIVRFTDRNSVKAKLLSLALLACALWAQAQGTLQFHATLTGLQVVPPNSDPTIARGDFWVQATY